MKNFTEFRGYICVSNPDGSIPLNSKVAAQAYVQDAATFRELIAQANLAYDLRQAMSHANTEQFKEAFERYQKALDVTF